MKRTTKIMVFDSGAGGLSIAREIIQELPACRLAYAADNAFFPYGTKDDDLLSARIVEQVGKFQQISQADIVVVACNTASTLALETLRSQFDTPFVGVVPAIKPAALKSQTGAIGILATSATIRRPYTHNLIEEFAPHCNVLLHASDALVTLAEAKICGQEPALKTLHQQLSVFINDDKNTTPIDTLVLACTHFPLLRHEISSFFKAHKRSVTILDSGSAIAKRVKFLLHEAHDATAKNNAEIEVLLSNNAEKQRLTERYRDYLLQKR